MKFLIFTGYLSAFSTVLVAAVAIFFARRLATRKNIFFGIYFLLAACTELLMMFYTLENANNMQVANTFYLLQFLLVFLALTGWIQPQKTRAWLYAFLAVAMVPLSAYFVSVFAHRYFDSFSSTIESVLLAVLAAYVLYQLTGDHSDYLYRNYKFWFAVAVFIYFSVSSIVSATGNYVLDNNTFLRNYTWVINSFLTILANAFFIKGLLCLKKSRT